MSNPASRGELFQNPDFDEEKFNSTITKNPPPHGTIGIFFTPRSGSSWLTDVLTQTRLLGKPQEWFNPSFVPKISRAVNARDLDSYTEMLRRKQKVGDVFSFEVTVYQMQRTFGSGDKFLSYFPDNTTLFYLTREDMVLQAVSLAKAVRSSVFHSVSSSADEVEKADTEFAYDAVEIARWLDHVFDQERKCEAFFAHNNLSPHRLTYEQIMTEGAEATARRFLRILRPAKVAKFVIPELTPSHRKIASARNSEYAARFRKEHPETMATIEAFRADRPGLNA